LAEVAALAESYKNKPTDLDYRIAKTIVYFENNHPEWVNCSITIRIHQPTQAFVELLIKQFNWRVRGTEEFWNKDQAKVILQLQAVEFRKDGHSSEHPMKWPMRPYR